MALSTCASSVVGTCTSEIPRRYVDAAKPAMSPMTPPPKVRSVDARSAFARTRASYTRVTVGYENRLNCFEGARQPVAVQPPDHRARDDESAFGKPKLVEQPAELVESS